MYERGPSSRYNSSGSCCSRSWSRNRWFGIVFQFRNHTRSWNNGRFRLNGLACCITDVRTKSLQFAQMLPFVHDGRTDMFDQSRRDIVRY